MAFRLTAWPKSKKSRNTRAVPAVPALEHVPALEEAARSRVESRTARAQLRLRISALSGLREDDNLDLPQEALRASVGPKRPE